MTNEEINLLVEKYFRQEDYKFPEFEHRYDSDSSAIMYSIIREFKPSIVLEIGTWYGGSTLLILSALKKNNLPFVHIASEMMPDLSRVTANNCLQHCGMLPMMIGKIEENLNLLPEEIDLLFVDTNHDRESTEWISKYIWPRLASGSIFAMHDWAVKEEKGRFIGKGDGGIGALPETQYILDLYARNEFPFEKIYWSYGNPAWNGMSSTWESAFWRKV